MAKWSVSLLFNVLLWGLQLSFPLIAASGHLPVWEFEISGCVGSSALSSDGLLYFGSYEFSDNKMYAINATTGEMVWSFEADSYSGVTTPVLDNYGNVFFGDEDAFIYSLDALSGSLNWKKEMDIFTQDSTGIAIDRGLGLIYSVCDYGIIALNATTGEEVWNKLGLEYTRAARPLLGHDNGMVYCEINETLSALDSSDGSILWSVALDVDGYFDIDSSNTLYVAGENKLQMMSGSDGSVLHSLDVDCESPVLDEASGMVYVYERRTLHAYSSLNGMKYWEFEAEDLINSLPFVGDEAIYFGTEDAFVYAVSLAEGNLLWTAGVETSNVRSSDPARLFAFDTKARTLFAGACDDKMHAYDIDEYPTGSPSMKPITQLSYDVDVRDWQSSLATNGYTSLTSIDLPIDEVATVKLPFRFNFFGNVFDHAYVSMNGIMTFGNGCDDDFSDCDAEISVASASSMSTSSDNKGMHALNSKIPAAMYSTQSSTGIYMAVLLRKCTSDDLLAIVEEIRLMNSSEELSHSSFAAKVVDVFPRLRMFTVSGMSREAKAFIQNHKSVLTMRREKTFKLHSGSSKLMSRDKTSVSSSDAYSWGIDRVDQSSLPLDEAYTPNSSTNYGDNVGIFVVDSGIDTTHVEFANTGDREVVNVFNYDGPLSNDTDDNGHGTAGGQFIGIASKANIYGVKVVNANGYGTDTTIISGLEYIYDMRVAYPYKPMVITMSLGIDCASDDCESEPLNVAVDDLAELGVPSVVSAGNDASDACLQSPAAAKSSITVGASEVDDSFASYSNFGSCMDIIAPGSDINSVCASSQCGGESEYDEKSGTSMATPHVAGVVALWLSQTSSSYSSSYPSVASIKEALQCNGVSDVISEVRSDTLNMFLQLPPPDVTVVEEAVCDTEAGCSDGCSGHGSCMLDMCICDEQFTGDTCDSDGPAYYVHDSFCCEGLPLDDTEEPPFNSIAFFWTVLSASSRPYSNVYFGSIASDAMLLVFDNVIDLNAGIVTAEVLLNRSGEINVAILNSSIGIDTPSYLPVSIGIKGPENGSSLQYEQMVTPRSIGLPNNQRMTFRPMYTVEYDEEDTSNSSGSGGDDDEAEMVAVFVGVGVLLVLCMAGVVVYQIFQRRESTSPIIDSKEDVPNPLNI